MKQVFALGAVAAALAVGAAHAAAGTNPNSLTLAVFGDSPYLDPAFPNRPDAEFRATPAFVDTINAEPGIHAVVHVGDIHSGSEACMKCRRSGRSPARCTRLCAWCSMPA